MTKEQILNLLNQVRETIKQYVLRTLDYSIRFEDPYGTFDFIKVEGYLKTRYFIKNNTWYSMPSFVKVGFSSKSPFFPSKPFFGFSSTNLQKYWYISDDVNEVFYFFIANGVKPIINYQINRQFDLIRELYQKNQIEFNNVGGNLAVMQFTGKSNMNVINQLLQKFGEIKSPAPAAPPQKTASKPQITEPKTQKVEPTPQEMAPKPQEKNEPKPQTEKKMNPELQALLECDKKRIDVAPYNKNMFNNHKQGHWDIKEPKKIDGETFYPRDPKEDIKDGVVGIDFGTRSTVVCYQDEKSVRIPMPIGDNGSADLSKDRYENPTIMCFASLDKFCKAYEATNEKYGRPQTSWNDLNVSHCAKKNFKDAEGKDFNAYLDNIKQWALGRNQKIKIKPTQEDNIYELKSLLNISDDDINPVEYYAYFIGSYINDMIKGVHLHYYLSFPATVENATKEKIRQSFEKGIRKSLPSQILEDEKIMKGFYVNGDCSEPLAYAACALQEYGFTFNEDDPKDDVNYAIFDFGGGTTDYNFGIWKESDSDNYDYEIETFGSNGLPTMGGENLLEDLAFEIFKNNIANLSQKDKNGKNIQFCYSPNSKIFAEADRYISESVEAGKNMHIMMEALREYWENSAEKLDKDGDNNPIEFKDTQFYCIDGTPMQGFAITATKEFVRDFFKNKIREAVRNFFSALNMIEGYQSDNINIFLAGNSCKSPYVREIFDEEIMNMEDNPRHFDIFPPLGTEDANNILKEKNIKFQADEIRPTGKTGVAFGLIETQQGGHIKICRKQQADTFVFYIGKMKKHKFVHFDGNGTEMTVEGKPNLNLWYNFRNVEEGETMFKLYYTDRPECLSDTLPDTSAMCVTCEIEDVDAESTVFIRAISSDTIEYVVADNEPDDSDKKIAKLIKKVTLKMK